MNEIKHVGVLGMRWGRRKGSSESSGSRNPKQLKRAQEKYDKKVERNAVKIHNHGANLVNKVLLPKLNKKYNNETWNGLKFDESGKAIGNSKKAKEYQKYYDDYFKMLDRAMKISVKELYGDRPK